MLFTNSYKWLKINYMTQVSTPNQLVRLAYGELPVLERLETEFALEENYPLREQYTELKEALAVLPKVTVQPAQTSIDVILAYSRNVFLEAHA